MLRPDVRSSPVAAALASGVLLEVDGEGDVHVVKRSARTPAGPGRPRVSLQRLLRERLAPMSPSGRQSVCDAVVTAVAGLDEVDQRSVGPALRTLVGALRERLPQAGQGRTLAVHKVLRIDPHRVYMSGRCGPGLELTAVSAVGERLPIARGGPHAFAAVLQHPVVGTGSRGWVVEARSADGKVLAEVRTPSALESAEAVCASLVADLADDSMPLDGALCAAAVDGVRAALRRRARVHAVDQHGPALDHPALTLLLPLGGDPASAEHQLARLATDPAGRVDILFVLSTDDDPAQSRARLRELSELYDVAFRVVVVQPKLPPAMEVDLGVRTASALVVVGLPEGCPVSTNLVQELSGPLFRRDDNVVVRAAKPEWFAVSREAFVAIGGMRCAFLTMRAEVSDLLSRAGWEDGALLAEPWEGGIDSNASTSSRQARAYDEWRRLSESGTFGVVRGC